MHEKVLDEVCENCKGYCILKEMALHGGLQDRTVIQLMCIDKFKFEESARIGRDIGYKAAFDIWIEKYANRFSFIYDELKKVRGEENLSYKEIFYKIMR